MSYFPDINAGLALVVDALHQVDIEASVDTAGVNPPGCWVRLSPSDPFPLDLLSGEQYLGVEVSVVVGAMPLSEAYDSLGDIASEVVETFGPPDGPIRVVATLFGNDEVALPTIVLPYHVALTPEGSPA